MCFMVVDNFTFNHPLVPSFSVTAPALRYLPTTTMKGESVYGLPGAKFTFRVAIHLEKAIISRNFWGDYGHFVVKNWLAKK